VPAVVPPGNPVKVGVVVATPAVPVSGTAVQQWMWADIRCKNFAYSSNFSSWASRSRPVGIASSP